MLLSLVTLLLGVVSRSYEGFESLVPRVIKILHRLNPERERDGAGHAVLPGCVLRRDEACSLADRELSAHLLSC